MNTEMERPVAQVNDFVKDSHGGYGLVLEMVNETTALVAYDTGEQKEVPISELFVI